jgi:Antitoxin FitA-like, ribbon-helix-helix
MTVMVQVRNVPEEVVDELKARAAARRLSLSDFLLERLQEIAAEPTLDEVLERLSSRPRRHLRASVVDLLDEARAE